MSELDLGDAFTFDEVVDAVQRYTDRPLRIVELTELNESGGVCAVLLVGEAEDVVVHARSESLLHRQQFVLHELAHVILDHGDDPHVASQDVLLPDIPPMTRRRILARQDLESDDEVAAEVLADHLAAGIRRSASYESKFMEIFG
ncbi:hypothetical protein [Microbacterium mangrovi]|nr:hypothetical protein [Microbacterium mangrovi]